MPPSAYCFNVGQLSIANFTFDREIIISRNVISNASTLRFKHLVNIWACIMIARGIPLLIRGDDRDRRLYVATIIGRDSTAGDDKGAVCERFDVKTPAAIIGADKALCMAPSTFTVGTGKNIAAFICRPRDRQSDRIDLSANYGQ